MALREIIEIDEELCDGCGACAVGCHEGAIRIIEGKARLIGESLCDGLGACIGECPRGAIRIQKREAEDYDEARVMEGLAPKGPAVIMAHFEHLSSHGQDAYVREAKAWLAARGLADPTAGAGHGAAGAVHAQGAARSAGAAASSGCADKPGGCPGAASRRFGAVQAARGLAGTPPAHAAGMATPGASAGGGAARPSALTHWPIQLHLINPRAPQFQGQELLVAADCTAFSLGSFHEELLAGKSLVIACPKLDHDREIYVDKLASLLDSAAGVTLAIMEVPCCSGLLKLAMEAREKATRKPELKVLVVGIEGGILSTKYY